MQKIVWSLRWTELCHRWENCLLTSVNFRLSTGGTGYVIMPMDHIIWDQDAFEICEFRRCISTLWKLHSGTFCALGCCQVIVPAVHYYENWNALLSDCLNTDGFKNLLLQKSPIWWTILASGNKQLAVPKPSLVLTVLLQFQTYFISKRSLLRWQKPLYFLFFCVF